MCMNKKHTSYKFFTKNLLIAKYYVRKIGAYIKNFKDDEYEVVVIYGNK